MSNLILPKKSAPESGGFTGFLSADAEDSGNWLDHGEYDSTFEAMLFVYMNQHAEINFNSTMSVKEMRSQGEIGYQRFKVKKWDVGLNWSQQWQAKIPPFHVGVAWNDRPVGILSPLMVARTCWHCGAYGWVDIPAARRLQDPRLPEKVPVCVPGYPCAGRIIQYSKEYSYRKPCQAGRLEGALDWWGHEPEYGMVERHHFQADCAEAVALGEDTNAFYDELSTVYDKEGYAVQIDDLKKGLT